jgi:hypothetical protein
MRNKQVNLIHSSSIRHKTNGWFILALAGGAPIPTSKDSQESIQSELDPRDQDLQVGNAEDQNDDDDESSGSNSK